MSAGAGPFTGCAQRGLMQTRCTTMEDAKRAELEELSTELALVTVADPSTEPDPRRAVIECYLQMLEVAARSGAERRSSETPAEYLRRILAATAAGRAPAISLTGLFERARYSRQPVGESMRSDAIVALDALRKGLVGSRRLTRALWATFFTTAAIVAIALGIALGVGAPDQGAIERAAAGALGLLGAWCRVDRPLGRGRSRLAGAPAPAAPFRGADRRRHGWARSTRELAPVRGFNRRRLLRAGPAQAGLPHWVVPRPPRCGTVRQGALGSVAGSRRLRAR